MVRPKKHKIDIYIRQNGTLPTCITATKTLACGLLGTKLATSTNQIQSMDPRGLFVR